MIHVTLPYPPSANSLWRNVNGKTLKSADYRRWLNAARAAIPLDQRGKINGPFCVVIEAERPDKRARDVDNLAKPVLDALKFDKATPFLKGVIRDDSDAQVVTLTWSQREPGKGAQVHVRVWPSIHIKGAA